MHDQRNLSKCVLFILSLQNVAETFRLYQLNDLTEDEFINHLRTMVRIKEKPPLMNVLNVIENDLNTERKNNINVRTRIYSSRRLEDKFKEPVLVKRIIPHGYEMGEFEYDSRLKTLYRPLIRVHVKKPMSEVENDIMKGETTNRNNGFLIVLVNRNSPKSGFVERIKRVLNLNKNNGDYKDFNPVELRSSSIFDKSGEAHDPYAPGKYPVETVEMVTEAPKKPKTEYPFWNFWTYDKNIHTDDCPGKLIKFGDFCMGLNTR